MDYELTPKICSFSVERGMPFEHVKKVARKAGDKFIRDMEKMGYRLHDGRLHLDPTPRIHTPAVELPSLSAIEKMGRDVVGRVVQNVQPSGVTDYRMWGLFAHKKIAVEVANGSRN